MNHLKIVLVLGFDTADIVKIQLPENYEVVGASFMELETVKGILQNVNWILINLSDLSKTDPLNELAVKKWREVFSDLVQKSIAADGHYAQLVGVAESPDWGLAELGVSIGARDLVLLSHVSARITAGEKHVFYSAGSTPSANVLPFRDPRAQPAPSPALKTIPLNAIPVPIRGLEGPSKAIEQLRNLVRKCAPTQATILISGETGVGKEHIARSIHENGLAAHKPFHIIHCSEVTENNFSEIFSSSADKAPGTILIDQIENLDPALQSRLSTYLADSSANFSSTPRPRILVSTQSDLKQLLSLGRMREDLYFRINVIEINVPSLRYRKGDLEDLADSLMARIARRNSQKRVPLSAAAFEKLLHYDWPGNVRELENVLEHASLSAWSKDGAEVEIQDLPEHVQSAEMIIASKDSLKEAVRRFEKEHIAKTLSRFGGSKEVTANALGMSLASLYRKLGNG